MCPGIVVLTAKAWKQLVSRSFGAGHLGPAGWAGFGCMNLLYTEAYMGLSQSDGWWAGLQVPDTCLMGYRSTKVLGGHLCSDSSLPRHAPSCSPSSSGLRALTSWLRASSYSRDQVDSTRLCPCPVTAGEPRPRGWGGAPWAHILGAGRWSLSLGFGGSLKAEMHNQHSETPTRLVI